VWRHSWPDHEAPDGAMYYRIWRAMPGTTADGCCGALDLLAADDFLMVTKLGHPARSAHDMPDTLTAVSTCKAGFARGDACADVTTRRRDLMLSALSGRRSSSATSRYVEAHAVPAVSGDRVARPTGGDVAGDRVELQRGHRSISRLAV